MTNHLGTFIDQNKEIDQEDMGLSVELLEAKIDYIQKRIIAIESSSEYLKGRLSKLQKYYNSKRTQS